MDLTKIFWNASLDELKKGYVYNNENKYVCLVCGKQFEQGYIYQKDGVYLDANKSIEHHIKNEHDSMFIYLLNMGKKHTGLTDNQKHLMDLFYRGVTDKEIAKESNTSMSTIRAQRFSLREKAKQAKVFLALMEILEQGINNKNEELIDVHNGATVLDDRYLTTIKERDEIIRIYFDGIKLKSFPTKQKRKIVVLQEISKMFDIIKTYNEKEVNEIIKKSYDDFATIRRYLVEYGFLDRTDDCMKYWIKK